MFFNTASEKVVRDWRIETEAIMYNKTIQMLAYADDIVLVGRTIDVLKEEIINLSKAVKETGLAINPQEAKYIEEKKKKSN
jgi:hypothetical protein